MRFAIAGIILVSVILSAFGADYPAVSAELRYLQEHGKRFLRLEVNETQFVTNPPGMILLAERFRELDLRKHDLSGVRYLRIGLKANEANVFQEIVRACTNLTFLNVHLIGVGLEEVSFPALRDAKTLTRLSIKGASGRVPEELYGLEKLEALIFVGGRDLILPEGASKLSTFEELSCFGFANLTLPRDLINCRGLKRLTIGSCNLSSQVIGLIPETVEEIYANDNQIEDADFSRFKRLKFINLTDNRMLRAPSELFRMPAIEYVILDGNRIKRVDVDGYSASLKVVRLYGNPVEDLNSQAKGLEARGVLKR